jgi:hypothetical protein
VRSGAESWEAGVQSSIRLSVCLSTGILHAMPGSEGWEVADDGPRLSELLIDGSGEDAVLRAWCIVIGLMEDEDDDVSATLLPSI